MAKEIRWSIRADQNRIDILAYWAKRNKSTAYSIRLNKLFLESVSRLSIQPGSGIPINRPASRKMLVKDYFIFYSVSEDYIEILTIRDVRRNPKKFKL